MKDQLAQEVNETRKKIEFVSDMLELIAKEIKITNLTNDIEHLAMLLSLEAVKLSLIERELSNGKGEEENETQRA